MSRREPRAPALGGLLAVEAGAVAVLHRLGRIDGFAVPWSDLAGWVREVSPDDALLATVRLVALGAAWWLLASTLLYSAARVTRRPHALRVAGWAALPCVRRIVDGALAVSITASGMAGAGAAPASADPPPSTTTAPVVIDLDHRDRTPAPPSTARQGRELESVPTPAPTSEVAVPPVPAQAGPRPARAPLPPPGAPPDQHVVVPGDNLWTIAAAHVGFIAERDPATLGDAEVASYWTRVIAENRTQLRSGDPDLIFPGEVVQLPPLV